MADGWRVAVVALWGSLALARATPADALCCDQPAVGGISAARRNANLVCPVDAPTCTVGAQILDGPTTCPASADGCALDFGERPVTFTGPFTVATGTLAVHAGSITVQAPIVAPGAVAVTLTATGTACAAGTGDVVVRQPIDVSAPAAGAIRLAAGCRIELAGSGQLLASSSGSFGGTIDLRAATTITQAAVVRATGAGSDGGIVSFAAGGDVGTARTIDVRSFGDGEGGSITLRAGDPGLGGPAAGGALTVSADLLADGSADSDGETGEDGGAILLEAAGPIVVTGTAAIRASGGPPDGAGGLLTVLTQEPPAGVLTSRDGDVTLLGPVVLRGATNGDGGDLDGFVGRHFALAGSLDLSGGGDDATAGNFILTSGGDLRLDGPVSVHGRVSTSTGGYVDLGAGVATGVATLTAARTIDVSAGAGSNAGDVRLAACRLVVQPNVLLDARSALASRAPALVLAGSTSLAIGAGSRMLAPPGAGALLVRAPATTVSIAGDATFDPPAATTVVAAAATPFPPCPICGDGIRQPDEPCDPGPAADGACCRSDCLALVCPTPTPSPTPSAAPTGPTASPTPTRTSSATATPTTTATATPPPPAVAPRAILGCARALAKGARALVGAELSFLETCGLEALACAAADPASCLGRAARRCQSRARKRLESREAFRHRFTKACAGDPPALPFALVRSPVGLGFATLDEACAAEVGLVLTSASAVSTCVERVACAAADAFAVALPQLPVVLPSVLAPATAGLCGAPAPPPPGSPRPARAALRCQATIVAAGRILLGKQAAVAARCLDGALACRLAEGTAASCAPAAERCRRKLLGLADPSTGTRARLGAAVRRACDALPPGVLGAPDGLGFDRVAATCLGLGAAPPSDPVAVADCLGTAYGCAAGTLVRRALPAIDAELARLGVALGDAFACPAAATPAATPTLAAATPTVAPTPTAVPTAPPVTLLLPGGGGSATDCLAEWTVVARPMDPPPTTTVACTDGDPACDADGIDDDACRFRVGICLGGTDPRLPDCEPAALATLTLQRPQPGAANPIDATNASALLGALAALTGTQPGGAGSNAFDFTPPLVSTPPAHCTAPVEVTVERRGLARRTVRLRARALGADGRDDRDALLLTCAAPGS